MTETPPRASPNRILFIGHDATLTGAPNSLLKIIDWIRQNSTYEPLAVLGRGGPMYDRYAAVCETHVWEPDDAFLRSSRNPSPLSRLLASMGQSRAAAIVSRRHTLARVRTVNPVCVFNNTGVTGNLLGNLSQVHAAPVVSRIPELEGYMRRNSRSGALRGVMSHSHYFIAVSQAVRENLVRRHAVDPARISVVYGACDDRKEYARNAGLRQQLGFAADDFVVCGCGSLDWRKGFDLFLLTAHRVCVVAGRRNIRFVWVGSPISQDSGIEYAYEIESLGLASSLVLMGQHKNPSDIFAQCDLFFLSSREDPFPLVMLEAAQQGLPLICFQGSGGATEFVQDSFGVTLAPLDIEGAGRAITEHEADRPRALAAGERARARAREFNVERMGQAVLAVIDQVVGNASGAGQIIARTP